MAGFGSTDLLNKAKSSVSQYLGISEADVATSPLYTTRDLASSYSMVSVTSSRNGEVTFKLPESFTINLKSAFSSLVEGKLGIVSSINKLLQASSPFTGSMVSLNTKFSTSQIWEGSSPVSLILPVEFNAVTDVNEDVMKNIECLSAMVLPSEGNQGNRFTDIFLRAPGPTPFDVDSDPLLSGLKSSGTVATWSKDIDNMGLVPDAAKSALKSSLNYLSSQMKQYTSKDTGDNITISMGHIIQFKRCIVTKVDWNFDCTRLLNGSGLPMRVTGNITFQTSTAMTQQDFTKSLAYMKSNKGILGDFIAQAQTSGLGSAISNAYDSAYNKVSTVINTNVTNATNKFKSWG